MAKDGDQIVQDWNERMQNRLNEAAHVRLVLAGKARAVFDEIRRLAEYEHSKRN